MSYPPIEELIPHAPPMVLIEELCDWAPGAASCALTVRERAPFVSARGTVESAVCVEYMAQTVAACLGYEALQGGAGVRVGMIIACKRFRAHAGALRVGDRLLIHARRVRGNDVLSHFDCHIERDGQALYEATLTLYHADKPPDES